MQFRDYAGCVRSVGYFALGLLVTGLLGDLLGILATALHTPFHRILDHVLLATILGSALWFERGHLRAFWRWNSRVSGEMMLGATLAGISVLVATLLGLFLGNWHLQSALPSATKFIEVVLAMILVPLVEETLFRGVQLGHLVRNSTSIWPAIFLSSAIYAACHFVRTPSTFDNAPISWLSAWQAEGAALMGLAGIVSWRFLNLWLIGNILGTLYRKTGRLWCGAAAHGIWVLALLLLPTWLSSDEGGMDLSATVWVTFPLIGIIIWVSRKADSRRSSA